MYEYPLSISSLSSRQCTGMADATAGSASDVALQLDTGPLFRCPVPVDHDRKSLWRQQDVVWPLVLVDKLHCLWDAPALWFIFRRQCGKQDLWWQQRPIKDYQWNYRYIENDVQHVCKPIVLKPRCAFMGAELCSYRGYACDIIIIPRSYTGTLTEWPKTTFWTLKCINSNRKVLSDCIKHR